MKVIENPTVVEDKDLKKAYEVALKFLESEGYKVKEIRMGISPFAPTYQKSMIIEIKPSPKDIMELIRLKTMLQQKLDKKVGVTLV